MGFKLCGRDADRLLMGTESGFFLLSGVARRWLDRIRASGQVLISSTAAHRGGVRVLDAWLVGSLVGLELTHETVLFVDLAFLGALVGALRLPFGSFVLR